eukprot:XP_001689853.1 predicted protein [Chlamydomonas reinhardtii]
MTTSMLSRSMQCSASAPSGAIPRRSIARSRPAARVVRTSSGAGNSGMPPPRARGHGGAADEEPENEDPTVKAAKIQAKAALVLGGAMFAGFFVLGSAIFAGSFVLADALRGVPAGFRSS